MSLFFENRQLKQLIRDQDDRIEQLQSIIDDLEAAHAKTITELNETLDKAQNDLKRVRTELTETKSLVRKQSAADMLLTALRAIGAVKDERPQPIDYQNELARYQAQYNQMSQGQSNLLSGLGLGVLGGGVFGQR